MKNAVPFLLLLIFTFTASSAMAESVYERVMRTGTIRCGYAVWPPTISISNGPNKLEGVFYDLMEEVGKRLSLNVEWTEEFGWATAIEGVATKRYDVGCANFWPTPQRARLVNFSIPVSYSALHAWVHPDSRLLGKIQSHEELNSEEVTFVSIDGTTPNQIIRRDFLKAKNIEHTEMTPVSDQLYSVSIGKGDVAIIDEATAHIFLKNNPGKLVKLLPNRPIVVKPNVVLLPADDLRFSNMIDYTLRDIIADGVYNEILKKYNATGFYLPLAKPYEVQK